MEGGSVRWKEECEGVSGEYMGECRGRMVRL